MPLSSAQLASAVLDPSTTTTTTAPTDNGSTTAPSTDTTTPAATSTTTPAASDTTTTTAPASDTTTTTTAPTTPAPAPAGPTVTLLVKTKSGLSASEQSDAIASHGGTEVDSVSALHLHIVTVPTADAMSALAAYQADTNVASVSLDNTRAVESITKSGATDPGYANQWDLTKIGWDQVHAEHDPSGSATLAVLDTGVDASTPDLEGRVVGGWSAFGSDPGVDANGHGTHVATIAAAKADDGNGIAGVAYQGVKVMPVQVLGADGTGTDADIINGLVYAVDHGADVVLMAFSNPGESAALQDAVNYAWSHGVIVVAAAGNDASATPSYPAGLAKVVGVGATDQDDAAASFSNTSDAVFVTAPGTDIPASDASGVTNISGTSASAAIVAGSAALLKAEDTSASPATIVGRIARNADPNTGVGGNGRVNVARAVGDDSTDGVTPAGVPGGGGPVVGPYVAAAVTLSFAAGQSPNPVAQGNSATYTVRATSDAGQINDVRLLASGVTGLGTGETATIGGTACQKTTSGGSVTWTLTISTTGSTPVGTDTFAVSVDRWSGGTTPSCNGTVSGTQPTDLSGSLVVSAGPPTKLAVTSINGGSNPTAGTAFSAVVQSQTAAGTASNVTTSTGVSLSLATGTGSLTGTLTGTIAAGASSTTVSGVLYNKAESGVSLTATQTSGTPSLTAGTSSTFTVNPGAATKLVIAQQPTSTTGGAAISPAITVQLQDANNNVSTSTANVTAAIGTNAGGGTLSGTTTVAAVNGTATFSTLSINKPGTGYTLTFASTGLTGATSSTFDIAVGPAAKLVFTQQPSSATAATAIAPAITVQVTDLGGNAVSSSATINMAIGTNPNSGSLSGTTSVAAVSGLATFSDISINKSGTGYTLTASSSGLTSATSSAFNITAGTADHISFGTQPSNTAAGASISPAVTVQVQDVNNNVVTTDSTTQIAVALGNNPAGSSLSGTATATASSGVATFSNLSLNKTGTGYTLTASSTPVLGSGATSNAFNITPGAANKLVFLQNPTSTTGGATISPAVTVQILDANNNLTTSTATVTIALGSNPGGATLSGTTSVAAISGTATFNNLSLNKAATGYTLAASSSGLTGATSTSFDIGVGNAAKLAFGQQPTSAVAGVAINPAVTVQIQDAGGNLVTSSTASVTVAFGSNPGSSTLSGTLTQNASGGIATFGDLSANKVATGYTLAASSTGLTGATSGTFNITPAAAAKLAFTTQPSTTVTAGTAFGTQPTVTVQDAFGNTVTTDASSVTLAITPGTGTSGANLICSANPKTASSGVAAFSGCQIDLIGSGYTLTATDGSLTSAVSNAITVNAGTAVNGDGTMTVTPNQVTAGSTGNSFALTFTAPAGKDFSASSYVTITVPSGWGTPTTGNTSVSAGTCGGTVTRTVSGQVVTVTLGSGCAHGNSFTLNYTGVTAPATVGTGQFTTASHNGSGGTASGIASQPVVTNIAGPAAKLAFSTQPATTTAGTAFGVVVQVQDVNGNLVSSSAPITLAIGTNPAGGTLSGTANVNASNGVASFSGLSIDKAGTGYTLVASTSGLTSATSTSFNINAGTATKLAITSVNGGVTPAEGTSFNVTIQSQDALGNASPVNQATGVNLSANGNGTATNNGNSIPSGSATIQLPLTYTSLSAFPESGISLTATRVSGMTLTNASTTITVNPPVCTTFTFIAAPSSVVAGSVAGPFTVQAGSPFGSACSVTAPVTLTQGTAAGTFFSDAGGTTPVTSVPWTGGTGAAVPGPHQATFYYSDTVAGAHTLSVASTGLTSNSTPLTVTPGPAAKFGFSVVPASVSADNTFSVTVQSTDQFGNVSPVTADTEVTLALASGAGPLNGTVVGTISSGQSTATFTGLSDHKAESITLSATDTSAVPTLTGGTSSAITITPGVATHVKFVQQPSTANGGSPISPAVSVELLDQFNNRANSTATVTLAIGTNPGGGALTGGSVAAVSGLATFNSATIDKAGTGYTLVASSAGLSSDTSSAFNVVVGPAAKLVIGQQPSNTVAGQALTPAVTVQIMDAGNNLTSATNNVTLAISTNPGGGTLTGGGAVAAVNGVATFAGLSIDKIGTGYRLQATSSSLTSVTTGLFNITPAAPAQLAFTTSPSSQSAGLAFATQPVVVIRDAFGNLTADTSNVTLSVTSGTGAAGASVNCTANPKAASAGTATFAGCQVDKIANNYTLTATDGSLTPAVSGTFNVTAATVWNMTPLAFSVRQNKAFTQQFSIHDETGGSARSCISIPTTGVTGLGGSVVTNPHSGASWAVDVSGSTIRFWRNSSNSAANMQTGETLVVNVTGTAGSPGSAFWSGVNAWSVTTGSTASTLCATSGSSYTPNVAYSVNANTAPTAPALSAPADTALTNDNTPTFTWASATDADNDTLKYEVQVATDAAFTNQVSLTPAATNLSALTYTPTGSLADGTYFWRVRAADDLTSGAFSTVRSFTIDTAPPETTSITRADTNPTNASTLHWTVSFSKNVTGVDANDFALAASGPAGVSITNVSGSGSTYTVTAAAGSGDGTLGLNLVDNDSIVDAAGNALGGTGAGNGNVTGEAYIIDRTGPTVTFDSTPAQFANSATADFTFHGDDPLTNGVASGVASLECSLDGAQFSACVSPLELTGLAEGGHTLDVHAIDQVGNVGSFSSFSWTVDTIAPEITAVSDSPDPTETTNTIHYTLSEPATVTVKVYDDQNNLVRTLVNAASEADGTRTVQWDLRDGSAVDVPSGVYTYKIDATDAAGNAADQQTGAVTVRRTTQVVVTSGPQTITAGDVSGVITVERRDADGVPTTAGDLVLHLSSTSGQGELRDATNPGDAITTVTIPDGSSTASFRYTDTLAGTPTVRAADQASGPDTGITDATQLVTVNAAAANHLGVSLPGSVAAGDQFDFTVTALDQYGNTDPNYAGTVRFSSDDANATLPGDSLLDAGTATFQATLTQAGTRAVTATDTTDSGITGQATTQVVHGAAASVLLTLVPDTIPADGAAHSTATAAVADTFGNAVPGDDVTITSPGDVTVSSVTDHGDGTYTADITASTTFGSNQVTAADGVHSDSKTLTETALEQTVTFDNPGTHTYGDAPVASNATASSGLTVTLSSTTPAVCGVSGLDVTILGAGNCSIDASQAGNAQYAAAPTVTRSFTVNPADTTTTVASNHNPSVFGQNVTFTASVVSTAGTPSGTVVFTVDNVAGDPVALDGSGHASTSTAALAVGTHTVHVDYTPDTVNYSGGSGSLEGDQTVEKADTTTVVQSSNPTAVFGEPVTFTATVAQDPASGTTPTGTVQFQVDSVDFGAPVDLANGAAQLVTPDLSFGNHTVGAVYTDGTDFNGSTATEIPQTVATAPTTTVVGSSHATSVFGEAVTFSATVTADDPSQATPVGEVQFLVDGTPFGGAVSLDSGFATSGAVSTLAVGGHTITAIFTDADQFGSSTSADFTQTVTASPTTTVVESSVNPSVFGQSVSFTATVSAAAASTATPEGFVQFKIDGAPFGAPVALSGGEALSGATTDLAVGPHSITADYSDGTDFVPSTSDELVQTVGAVATTTVVSPHADSVFGESVTFDATVAADSPSTATPAGQVQFKVDGNDLGSPVTLDNLGHATSPATADLSVDDHQVTAVFLGTAEFTTSTSSAVTQTVTAVGTTTTVTQHANSVFGESVAFDATVAADSPSTKTPAGQVQFKVDGNDMGSPVTLDNLGHATSISKSDLAVGDHDVTAVFLGTTEFTTSTSAVMTQTVTAVDTTTTVSQHAPSAFGESVTFDATVTSASPSLAVPAGQVQFKVDGNALGSPVTLDNLGHATSDANSSLTVGSHAVTAEFTDGNQFNVSTSAAMTQVVGSVSTTTVVAQHAASVFGESVTFDATVSADSPSTATPAGQVQFKVDGNDLGSPVALDGSGHATSPATADLTVGPHSVTAEFSDGGEFDPSASEAVTQTVGAAATTTVVTQHADSVFGESVAFDATVSADSPSTATPAGQVQFKVDGNDLGSPVPLDGSGHATSPATADLTIGGHGVTAVFLGTTEFTTSTSSAVTQTVGAAATTTVVAQHADSVFGANVTFDVTVSQQAESTKTPVGQVQFKVDGNDLGSPVTLDNLGHATSDAISSLSVGGHSVTAEFTDATEFAPSTSAAMTQTVTAVDTTTTVTPHATSAFGESVTFAATVTSESPSLAVPAGQVQFKVDGTALGLPVTLDNLGHATSDAISSLSVGDHQVTAEFSDGNQFNESTSVAMTQTVGAATTTTSVQSSDTSSVFGQTVTFDATVVVSPPSAAAPAGTVTFLDGATPLGSAPVGANGHATFDTSSLGVGGHSITAVFSDGGEFAGSTSDVLTQDVGTVSTTTTVGSDVHPSVFGQSVTFTATVTAGGGSSATPAGDVQFKIDGNDVGSPVALDANGKATYGTAGLTVGTHHVAASFSDGAEFGPSTSGTFDQVVGQASTTTSIDGTVPAATVVGESYLVSVSVTAVAPGAGVPSGFVDVLDSDGHLCQVTLDASGAGSCQLPSTSFGTKTLSAQYEGDTSFTGSNADQATHDVTAADTTTTVTSSLNPSVFGQNVTFTATVTANAPSTAVPTGLVQFKIDGTDFSAQVPVDGTGHASVNTSGLAVGDHSVQAFYVDASDFNPSNGTLSPQQHVAEGASETSIVSALPDPTVTGEDYTVVVNVLAAPPASGVPTGTVHVTDSDGNTCDSTLDTLGIGSCDLPSDSAGPKTLHAHYEGDAGFAASDATAVTHNVSAATTTTSVDTDANPSVFGQTVTFTATVSADAPSAAIPSGDVQFVVDGTSSGSPVALDNQGQATIQLGGLAVGDHTVVAHFLGTADFAGSQGTLTPDQEVDRADTTTVIAGTAPATTVVGQGYSVSVTVAPVAPGAGVPTGTVHVTDSNGNPCDVTLVNGAGSCLLPSSSAGTKTLHADYAGDLDFTGSSAAPASHVVTAAGTTTSLASSLNPSALGDDVTFTATVTSNPPSLATVTGAVQFAIDGTNFGSPVALDGSGHASVHSATLPVGDHTVTAAFVASTDFGGSSASLAPVQHVSAGASATSIVSDTPDPSVTGQSYTVSVHVAAVPPAFGTPTGVVTVSDSDGHSCPVTLDGSGNGSCQLLSGPAGAKTVTAHYAGDSSFSASDAASAAHEVDATPTTTTVASTLNPSVFGQSVTFTATVSANAPSTAVPTGSVQFVVDGSNSGAPVALDTGGQASVSRSDLGAGGHTVVAQFLGSADFNSSQGTLTPNQVVQQASTAVAITSDLPDPSVTGQSVTVQYAVSVLAPGSGVVSGNVVVVDQETNTSCTASVATGQCSLVLPTAGTHHLLAAFQGSANFVGSASALATHTVNKDTVTAAVTSDSPDPSVVGQPVTVGYSVTADLPGSGTPTGQVLVTDDDSSAVCLGTVGSSCSISLPTAGAHHLRAMYLGDANFQASSVSATAAPHTVNPAATVTAILSDTPDPSAVGQSVTVHYLVAVSAPGQGTPAGTVVVTDQDSAATCSATVADGQCSLPLTTAGLHHLVATYQGSADLNGSSSNPAAHTVTGPPTVSSITLADANPTNAASVHWTVTFSAPVTGVNAADFQLANAGLGGSPQITGVSGSGASYSVTASTGSGAGTLGLNLVDDDSITDALGTPLGGSGTGNGNAVGAAYSVDLVAPSVTVNQAAAQADPTSTSPVSFTVVFSESVADFTAGDVTVGGTATHGAASVSGSGTTYTVSVPVSANGTVIASVAANLVHDAAGNANTASTSTDNTVTFQTAAPLTVTVNQAAAQADPTSTSPVSFTVVFSSAVSDFTAGDVTIGGTATHGAASVTGSGTTYTVSVPVSSPGTVTASLAAGVAHDSANTPNAASTSTDNTVTFQTAAPLTVTVNQAAAQADPTGTSPVAFTVVFSSAVSDFTAADVTVGGTATHGAASVTGSGTTYTVSVPVTTSGTVTASLAAGVAHDSANTPNTASSSTDNQVTFDNVRPSVTVDQAAAQAAPTSTSPVSFTVVFSEPVADFTAADVTVGGTATHGAASVSGSGTTYTVSVPVSTAGTVTAAIAQNLAHDAAGNGNTASTSTDNTVTFQTAAPLTVTSVNPASRGQGAANQTVTVNGSGFGGANGTFAGSLAFSGSGVTVNSVTKSSSTQLTANISVSSTASTGARNVTVTNPAPGGSASCNGCFTVTARPTVTSLSPSSRARGAANQNVSVTGTNFVSGATVAFSGTGITVNSVTRNSATSLTVNLSVAANATVGSRDVTVTNPDAGTFTLGNGFSVTGATTPPTVTLFWPQTIGQGATNQTFSLVGSNFQTGINVAFSGTGITVNWIARQTSNQVWINVDVAGNAPLGARTVTVTNPDGGSVVLNSATSVTARPTITSISPNTKARGTGAQDITITGTNFVSGATVTISGKGISISSVTRNSSTSLTVRLSVSSSANTGFRDVTVMNPDWGTFTVANGFRIT